ncbi:MAG: hypothetical protein ACXWCG_01790, partial [Flavitalea sp.]
MKRPVIFWSIGLIAIAILLYAFVIRDTGSGPNDIKKNNDTILNPDANNSSSASTVTASLAIDTTEFKEKLARITNRDSSGKWPVKSPFP